MFNKKILMLISWEIKNNFITHTQENFLNNKDLHSKNRINTNNISFGINTNFDIKNNSTALSRIFATSMRATAEHWERSKARRAKHSMSEISWERVFYKNELYDVLSKLKMFCLFSQSFAEELEHSLSKKNTKAEHSLFFYKEL